MIIIVNQDNTLHVDYCDYGEVSGNVTGDTYNSVLTVHVVCAGVVTSGCLKVGKLLLGSREGVHLNSGTNVPQPTSPSSHYDPVLKFYGTSMPENEDGNNNKINIYSALLYTIIT